MTISILSVTHSGGQGWPSSCNWAKADPVGAAPCGRPVYCAANSKSRLIPIFLTIFSLSGQPYRQAGTGLSLHSSSYRLNLLLFQELNKLSDINRIKLGPGGFFQLSYSLIQHKRLIVSPSRSHRVKRIGNGDYLGPAGIIFPDRPWG